MVHVVRSDSFAGVERYVCGVANELDRRGQPTAVIGGDPTAMRNALVPSVSHQPAATTVAACRALLSGDRPAVVHAHMTAGELAAVLARPLLRRPVIVTRHFAAARGASPAGRLAAALVRRGVSQQIAISEYVARSIGEDSTVVLSGVPDVRVHEGPRPKVVLVMQRQEAEKQTDVAIRAWAAADLASRGWRMVVAGTGSEHERLCALASNLRVDDSVEWRGFVPDADGLLRQAGIFLATTPIEAFGLATVEAMAHGLPVVAAAAGGHLETVADAGLLFPPGDAEACAGALRRLVDDEDLRRRLGRAALDRQREHLSISAHVDVLQRMYLTAVEDRR